MNLPADALMLIPWVRDYENSDQGKKPQDFNAYLEQWWASVWDDVQEEFQKIVDDLVMFFLASFPWAWLLVRAALLILIYVIFAFILLSIKAIIYGIAQLLLLFQTVMELDLTSSDDSITVDGDYMQLNISYDIIYKSNNEFQFEYPSVVLFIESAILIFNLVMDFYKIYIKINDCINEWINDKFPPESIEYLFDLLSNTGTGMSILGSTVGIQAGVMSFCKDEVKEKLIFVGSTAGFLISLGIALYLMMNEGFENIYSSTFIGLGIGFFIAGVVFFRTELFINKDYHYRSDWLKDFGLYVDKASKTTTSGLTIKKLIILDFLLTLLDVNLKITEIFGEETDEDTTIIIAESALSLYAGSLSLFLASYSLVNLANNKREGRSNYACLWGLIAMSLATMFLSIGINKLQNEIN